MGMGNCVMIKVGKLYQIAGKESEYWATSYVSAQYTGTWTSTSTYTSPSPGVNINMPIFTINTAFVLGEYLEEYHKHQQEMVVSSAGMSMTYTFQPTLNKKFIPNGTVGLAIWTSIGQQARMLIEDKIYIVPFTSLAELTEENVAA